MLSFPGHFAETMMLIRTSVFLICLQCRTPWFDPCIWKIPWRRDRLPTPVFLGFPCGSSGKESACNAGDPNSIPGLGRSAGEGIGYPLQYSWASRVAQLVRNPGHMGSIPGLGRSAGEGKGYPLQYSSLENSSPWGHKESDTTV